MDFYRTGQLAAARGFFKNADYADSLAGLWEKASPAKAPLGARIAGGVLGAVPGAALGGTAGVAGGWTASPKLKLWPDSLMPEGMTHPAGKGPTDWTTGAFPGKVDSILQRTLGGGAAGAGIGGAAGAYGGVKATDAAYRALAQNRRAAGIRRVAPKAALALGATATAAALAHHFLTSGSDEKRAAIFGAGEPYDVDTASIPYGHRRSELKDYLETKSKEDPTPWWKAIGGGALGGGLLGGILGAVTGHPGSAGLGALAGGGIGAGLGGVTGGIAGLADRGNISSAKGTLSQGGNAVDKRLHDNVRYQRAMGSMNDYYTDQSRHEEMMQELRRRDR